MQALLRSVTTLGSRALSTLIETDIALHSLAVSSAQRSAPCAIQHLELLGTVISTSRGQAVHTSSSVAADVAAPEPSPSSSTLPVPASAPSAALHLNGSRVADPGEPRYTAPYWVPKGVRKTYQLPNVLFTDPWPSHQEHELRRLHAQALLNHLRLAGQPLTVQQAFEGVNRSLAAAAGSGPGVPPPLGTAGYAKRLLEHLRRNRMVYGIKNPESSLSAGHWRHPRLYAYLPFQTARLGHPEVLAKQDAVKREEAVQQALRRLRRGKPPYAIHRRRARFSVWQHLQVQEALEEAATRPALTAE